MAVWGESNKGGLQQENGSGEGYPETSWETWMEPDTRVARFGLAVFSSRVSTF